jgi:hypothetical protein
MRAACKIARLGKMIRDSSKADRCICCIAIMMTVALSMLLLLLLQGTMNVLLCNEKVRRFDVRRSSLDLWSEHQLSLVPRMLCAATSWGNRATTDIELSAISEDTTKDEY